MTPLEKELLGRVAELERVVNLLDREAEVMGASIEHQEHQASTFLMAIGILYQTMWSEATLNGSPNTLGRAGDAAFAWQCLYPEYIMEGCSARQSKAHPVYRRPSRRWALYGSVASLKALAAEHGLPKRKQRWWTVRDLEDARVDLERADVISR